MIYVYLALGAYGALMIAWFARTDTEEDERDARLAEFAALSGMDYRVLITHDFIRYRREETGDLPEKMRLVVEAVDSFPSLSAAPLAVWKNLMLRTEAGATTALFDAIFKMSKSASFYTMAARLDDRLSLPHFELRPRMAVEKWLPDGSGSALAFGADPGFSEEYLLWGEDENAVRSLFVAGPLEFFRAHRGWTVKGQGRTLLCYAARNSSIRHDYKIPADGLGAYLDEIRALFAAFRAV